MKTLTGIGIFGGGFNCHAADIKILSQHDADLKRRRRRIPFLGRAVRALCSRLPTRLLLRDLFVGSGEFPEFLHLFIRPASRSFYQASRVLCQIRRILNCLSEIHSLEGGIVT